MGAVDDFGRVEEALVCLCLLSTDFAKDLAIRDSSSAQALRAAVADETFWHQAKASRMVITGLMGFMQWVSGCKCHEELLRQGKAIRCAKKGCRAGEVAAQLQFVLSQISKDRQQLRSGQYGQLDVQMLSTAMTHVMACLGSKLHWLSEIPYLVWQAFD